MLNDGVNNYTWDRANRLLSMGSTSYQYDGEGRRVQQSVGATVTKYLLDLQPGLAVTLSETTGAAVTQYVHGPRGIHAQKDSGGNWEWMLQDGLGSVRAVADANADILWSSNYDPYGISFGSVGTAQTNYGFTGEYTDPVTGQVHLRARDYNPVLGAFGSLDPFEQLDDDPMLINAYGYVTGNPVNMVDPTGLWGESPALWNQCDPGIGISNSCSPQMIDCDQWPHNDHPLVYRLCTLCHGAGTPATLSPTPLPVPETLPDLTALPYSCNSPTVGDSICKRIISNLLNWVWQNGDNIGRRAVNGFVIEAEQRQQAVVVEIVSPQETQLFAAGTYGYKRILKLNSDIFAHLRFWKYLPESEKLFYATSFVHEMEHFHYDTPSEFSIPILRLGGVSHFQELRAYLSGYLFLREKGLNDKQIASVVGCGSPTWWFGHYYCFKGNPFTQSFMTLLGELGIGNNGDSRESRLPLGDDPSPRNTLIEAVDRCTSGNL